MEIKRKVNRAAIMQLYGAMAYQDCTKAVIATDGELLDDAISVAKKLKIEILTTKTNFVSTFHKEKKRRTQILSIKIFVWNIQRLMKSGENTLCL